MTDTKAQQALSDPEGKKRRTEILIAMMHRDCGDIPGLEADCLRGVARTWKGQSITAGDNDLIEAVFDINTVFDRIKELSK